MKQLLSLILLTFSFSALGATITALDCTTDAVSNAVTSATAGDIVVVPAGSCVWTYGYILSKGVQVIGAGVKNTLLGPEQLQYITTNSTETILIDRIASRGAGIEMQNSDYTHGMRISGFRVKGDPAATNTGGGFFLVGSTADLTNGPPTMLDTIVFENMHHRLGSSYGYSGILIGNCIWIHSDGHGWAYSGQAPSSANKGDLSWATDVAWGTANSGVFMEYCFITNSGALSAGTDGFAGCRAVIRYSTLYNMNLENHELGNRTRSARGFDAYGLKMVSAFGGPLAFIRGGGGNFTRITNSGFSDFMILIDYMQTDPFDPFGQQNGTNVWGDNISGVQESGTHTGANGASVLTDGTKSWTNSFWVKFAIQNRTSGKSGLISANTGTTITPHSAVDSAYFPTWNNGDSYQIFKVNHSLDACGTGTGDMLSGGSDTVQPINAAFGVPTWPRQVDDPIHYWDNVGVAETAVTDYSAILPGRNETNTARTGWAPIGEHPTRTFFLGGAPAAPSNLSASVVSDSQINLTWTDGSSNEDGFELNLDTNSGFPSPTVIGGISANATAYNSVGLVQSTTYYYRLRATNSFGASSYTSTASATTQSSSGSVGAVPAIGLNGINLNSN